MGDERGVDGAVQLRLNQPKESTSKGLRENVMDKNVLLCLERTEQTHMSGQNKFFNLDT